MVSSLRSSTNDRTSTTANGNNGSKVYWNVLVTKGVLPFVKLFATDFSGIKLEVKIKVSSKLVRKFVIEFLQWQVIFCISFIPVSYDFVKRCESIFLDYWWLERRFPTQYVSRTFDWRYVFNPTSKGSTFLIERSPLFIKVKFPEKNEKCNETERFQSW